MFCKFHLFLFAWQFKLLGWSCVSEILSGPTSHTASHSTEWQSTSVTCVFCVNLRHARPRLGRIVTKQMAPWLGRNQPSASWWLWFLFTLCIQDTPLWSLYQYHCKICTLLHLMATWHCTVYCPCHAMSILASTCTPSNKLAQIELINYLYGAFLSN